MKYRDLEISGIEYDSRKIKKNNLFFVLNENNTNTKTFINQAIQNGACAIVSNKKITNKITNIVVANTAKELAIISKNFYNKPDKNRDIYAVTGTNGKTSTTYILQHLNPTPTAVIGTIQNDLLSEQHTSTLTTPLSRDLFEFISKIPNNSPLAIEISSHALDQFRTYGLDIDVAIFTNLTSDHLDYHKTQNEYFLSKKRLFNRQNGHIPKLNIINTDDTFGRYLYNETSGITFGLNNGHYSAQNIKYYNDHTEFDVIYNNIQQQFYTNLIGTFNIYNILGAIAALHEYKNIPLEYLSERLLSFNGTPGRLEKYISPNGSGIFIDFAHTEYGLLNVLTTLKQLPHKQLIVVFGCGGDRDKSKRPLMMKVANNLADLSIITEDNPRTEDIANIWKDMQTGITNPSKVFYEPDRKKAIYHAVNLSTTGDIILLAGKGHENYIDKNNIKTFFSESHILINELHCKKL